MTERWKRRALAERQLGEPANVRFVPVDLAAVSLGAIETPAAATWNWLGVTMYLERLVTEQALKVVARRGIGTTLVVNFVLAEDETDDFTRAVQATAAAVVGRDGEPIRAAYTRSGCVDLLEKAGFSSVTLFDAATLKERYFPHRRDLRLADSTLVCLARV